MGIQTPPDLSPPKSAGGLKPLGVAARLGNGETIPQVLFINVNMDDTLRLMFTYFN
ncbi:MAG TPA: hypothetical protein VE944_22695 [Nostoc sp.]|uniref:hypothetical protein n=1 Tax=Nostoc sp. TaxID=1180 RepID=UPI002D4EB3A3|nr:hypothetical protein [Nostoc sp.]HYX17105.1 hypothetical protein [Nostoc sp.]